MNANKTYLLTVITINYNGLNDTCELLDTLPLGCDSLEVIVVDNASRDDEATAISQRYPQVNVVRSAKNLGFAGGNNLGIKAAHGRYLFFVNNDTLLFKTAGMAKDGGENVENGGMQWFQPLIGRLESDPAIGIVCPKIRFSWDDSPIQFAGYTPLTAVTMRNRSIGFGEADNGQYDQPHPTPYAHGAAMMVRREAIERAGMMPECYFLYYEELDWSMMMRRAGYSIWYEPAATIYHKESRSTGQGSPLRTYYITRNRLLFISRNSHGANRLLSWLYLMCAVAPKDILKSLLHGRTDLAKATIKGIVHFIKL